MRLLEQPAQRGEGCHVLVADWECDTAGRFERRKGLLGLDAAAPLGVAQQEQPPTCAALGEPGHHAGALDAVQGRVAMSTGNRSKCPLHLLAGIPVDGAAEPRVQWRPCAWLRFKRETSGRTTVFDDPGGETGRQ